MTEIIVPSPGESITQVQIARWLVSDGETVDKDQEVVEIDSDKATFPVSSPVSGKLRVLVPEGETVGVGKVIANIRKQSAGRKKNPPGCIRPVSPGRTVTGGWSSTGCARPYLFARAGPYLCVAFGTEADRREQARPRESWQGIPREKDHTENRGKVPCQEISGAGSSGEPGRRTEEAFHSPPEDCRTAGFSEE